MSEWGGFEFIENMVAAIRFRAVDPYPQWRWFTVQDSYMWDLTLLYTFYNNQTYCVVCSYPHVHDESYQPEYMVALYVVGKNPSFVTHEYHPDKESLERFAQWLKSHLEDFLMENSL